MPRKAILGRGKKASAAKQKIQKNAAKQRKSAYKKIETARQKAKKAISSSAAKQRKK